MKTTDSVMREEIIEFFSHHPTKQSARNFLTRRLSHSLAEARREWVEEMRGKVEELLKHPKNGRGNNTPHRWRTGDNCEGCGKDISDRDKRALFCFECAKKRSKETNTQTREKGLLEVIDLLTGDNPEEAK